MSNKLKLAQIPSCKSKWTPSAALPTFAAYEEAFNSLEEQNHMKVNK